MNIEFETASGAHYTLSELEGGDGKEYRAQMRREADQGIYDFSSGKILSNLPANQITFWDLPQKGESFMFFHSEVRGCRTTTVVDVKEKI